jgi:hypothetical protein
VLQEAADRKPGAILMSEAMVCAAREAGLFFLSQMAQPSFGLQSFILGRCGALTGELNLGFLEAEVPPEVPEEEIFAEWRPQTEDLIAKRVGSGQRLAGLWFGRRDGHAVLILASGPRRAHLEPVAMVAAEGKVVLQGELFFKADQLRGLATHGQFGFRECTIDEAVALPQLRVECAVAPEDAFAWIELVGVPPGRILGQRALLMLVRPSGEPLATYSRPAYAEEVEAAAPGDFITNMTSIINTIRGRAGIPPVEVDFEQSAAAAMLAPHYFAALMGIEPEVVADTVVLGLRAGWQIDGIVRYGRFSSTWLSNTNDLGRLLAASLELPYGRATLLDPEVERLAVGSMAIPEVEGMAALFCTYALFDEQEHTARVDAVLERLTAARSAKARRPPVLLSEVQPLAAEAANAIRNEELAPDKAMQRLIRHTSRRLERPVRAWILEAASLGELTFPPDILEEPKLGVALAVAVSRRPGFPWGRYVVVVLIAEPRKSWEL